MEVHREAKRTQYITLTVYIYVAEAEKMAGALHLPLVDLFSDDRATAVRLIRQACLDHGFFYLTNHGIDGELSQVFRESKNFFSMPLDAKLRVGVVDHNGYVPPENEILDPSKPEGDLKECFYMGSANDNKSFIESNHWPPEESSPLMRATMDSYFENAVRIGKQLSKLIALSLDLDEHFFEINGAMNVPMGVMVLLHYPGELGVDDKDKYGVSAHSDYGMITLLATDGVPGLEICREKDRIPQLWERVPHVEGALVINIGDMLERWTNCLYRSTLHRVISVGKERYSVAFFLHPNLDFMVECLETCCSDTCPPRFPPIRCSDYLKERMKLTFLDN